MRLAVALPLSWGACSPLGASEQSPTSIAVREQPLEAAGAKSGAKSASAKSASATALSDAFASFPDPCRDVECVPEWSPCTFHECKAARECGAGSGEPLYVKAAYHGDADGTKERPFADLQAAIDAAPANTQIRVATGTYGTISVSDKAVHLCGGWAPTFDARDTRTYPTTLDGNNREKPVASLLDARHSTLVGFHVQGGSVGVWIESRAWPPNRESSAPRIADNVIHDNGVLTADKSVPVGGVWVRGGYATIQSNTLHGNQGDKGAALRLHGVEVIVLGNRIANNRSGSDHGGAVFSAVEQGTYSGNLFQSNEVGATVKYGWGGAMLALGEARLVGNVWTDNYAPSHGSALFVDEGANVVLEREVFFANRCSKEGGTAFSIDGTAGGEGSKVVATHLTVAERPCEVGAPVLMEASSELTVSNSIVWSLGGGTALDFQERNCVVNVRHSIVGEITGAGARGNRLLRGPGVSSSDPLFAAASRHDFHLRSKAGRWDAALTRWVNDEATSPAIDAADPASPFERETAPNGARANLGAFGNTPWASRSPR